MDLGEDIDERLPGEDEKFDASSAADTLRALDALWYIGATKKARWMDIIGDYAGEELSVIDGAWSWFKISAVLMGPVGDSLVQRVLDDPLLALGKAGGEPSPCTMHHCLRFFQMLVSKRYMHCI